MIALKVTTIHDAGGSCVRGHAGCGTCTRIKGSFDLVEETEEQGDKDTRKLRLGCRPLAAPKTYSPYIYAADVVG